MIEKTIFINKLLDFYGDILTETQRKSLNMYYKYDYSLNEIAEELNISKQAVSHNIKRGELKLLELEDKLELIKKSNSRNEHLIYLTKGLEDVEALTNDQKILNKINLVKTIILKLEEV